MYLTALPYLNPSTATATIITSTTSATTSTTTSSYMSRFLILQLRRCLPHPAFDALPSGEGPRSSYFGGPPVSLQHVVITRSGSNQRNLASFILVLFPNCHMLWDLPCTHSPPESKTTGVPSCNCLGRENPFGPMMTTAHPTNPRLLQSP